MSAPEPFPRWLRAPRYATLGNIMMTLVAALPILLVLLVVLAFSGAFGTFHI